MVRLLSLLESARPTDVRAIASALPEAELAAAVEAVQGRISLALREYILTEGSSTLLVALARQAILTSGPSLRMSTSKTMGRILMRFDPEADAAFFETGFSGGRHDWARRAILRHRKGPDGRAVITPRVKQLLLDAVADADAAGRGEAADRLVAELATADDPDLVRAALPYADRLSASEAARAILTLDEYGHRAEVKRHRGLWAGRGRTFTFLGTRRFSVLPSIAEPDRVFSPARDSGSQPVSLEQYRELVEQHQPPGRDALRLLYDAAQVALRAGTVSAAEILEHTRPAVLTVSLAFREKPECLRPDERRVLDDMRGLITKFAVARLGDDPQRWIHAIKRIR
jgi:hypothetical protein